jgi:hypothetical protein
MRVIAIDKGTVALKTNKIDQTRVSNFEWLHIHPKTKLSEIKFE